MLRFLIYLGIFLMPVFLFSQKSNCDVEIEALQGTYQGDCKKGKAHGKGIAIGTDTYEGTFRKGEPHGVGKYTWANGDIYEGDWRKGKKEGQGQWYMKEKDTTLKGYWIDDEYIGTEKDPYKIITRSTSVNRVTFNRQNTEPLELEFNLTYLGKPVKFSRFAVSDSFGVITKETDYAKTITVYDFPMKGTVSFETNIRGSGSQDGEIFFQINQAGQWILTIELREE